jgi:hypothetical protein
MRDALKRARHYRNRAAECELLAESAQSAESKDHYLALAASYIALAEAEEITIQGRAVIADRTTKSESSAD